MITTTITWRVASGGEIPIALGSEEPGGHAPNESIPGFGAAITAPYLHRNQRQLLVTPFVRFSNFDAVDGELDPIFFVVFGIDAVPAPE